MKKFLKSMTILPAVNIPNIHLMIKLENGWSYAVNTTEGKL